MCIDLIELVYEKDGFDKIYQEIKESEQKLIEINGNSYNAIADRNLKLKQKQDSFFEDIERMMLDVALRKKALQEIKEELFR